MEGTRLISPEIFYIFLNYFKLASFVLSSNISSVIEFIIKGEGLVFIFSLFSFLIYTLPWESWAISLEQRSAEGRRGGGLFLTNWTGGG